MVRPYAKSMGACKKKLYINNKNNNKNIHGCRCPVSPHHALQHSSDLGITQGPAWYMKRREQETYQHSLTCHFGSTMCSGYSPEGHLDGSAHVSERSHASWVSERRDRAAQHEESLYFHENKVEYDVQVQQVERLSDSHKIISVTCDVLQGGYGVSRTRRFTAGIGRHAYVWIGSDSPQLEWESLYLRSPQADGNMYLVAPDAELYEMYNQKCCKSHVYFDEDAPPSTMVDLALTADESQRLKEWKRQANMAGIDDWFAELKDHPRGATPKTHLPCIMPSSRIWSSKRCGLLTSNECLLAQGLSMYAGTDCHFAPVLSRCPWTERIRFAGGTFHAPLYALFVCWIISSVVPREVPKLQSLAMACDYSDVDEDDENDI